MSDYRTNTIKLRSIAEHLVTLNSVQSRIRMLYRPEKQDCTDQLMEELMVLSQAIAAAENTVLNRLHERSIEGEETH